MGPLTGNETCTYRHYRFAGDTNLKEKRAQMSADATALKVQLRDDLENWLDDGIIQALATVGRLSDGAMRMWKLSQDMRYSEWRQVVRVIADELALALTTQEISTEAFGNDGKQ